jgi:hypothetical protein
MTFSPSNAAFEGFRLARRRPLTVVALSVLSLISSFATYWIMDVSGYMRAANAINAAGPSADPAQAMAMLGPMFTFLIGVSLMGCFITAIQAAAIYRGVLRPQEHGFLGLALGGDEARLFGLGLIIVGLALAAYTAAIIIFAIVFGILGAVVAASGAGTGATIGLVTIAALAFCAAALWLGVKMSLAGPATFARRQLTVFGSWSLTKGQFWNLLGCYFLAYILAMLIGFIMFVVALIVASTATGVPFTTAAGEFFQQRRGVPMDLFSPVRVIYTLVAGLFGGLLSMVVMAPAAEAYRQLHQSGSAEADTFS